MKVREGHGFPFLHFSTHLLRFSPTLSPPHMCTTVLSNFQNPSLDNYMAQSSSLQTSPDFSFLLWEGLVPRKQPCPHSLGLHLDISHLLSPCPRLLCPLSVPQQVSSEAGQGGDHCRTSADCSASFQKPLKCSIPWGAGRQASNRQNNLLKAPHLSVSPTHLSGKFLS